MLCRVSFFQDLLSRKGFFLAPVMKYVFTRPTDLIAFLLGGLSVYHPYVMYSIIFAPKKQIWLWYIFVFSCFLGRWQFIIHIIIHMLCNVQYHFFQKKDLVIIHILSIKSNNPIRTTYEIWLWYISGLSSIFSSICLSSTVILSSIYYVSSIIFPSYLHNSLIKSQHRSILSSIYYP